MMKNTTRLRLAASDWLYRLIRALCAKLEIWQDEGCIIVQWRWPNYRKDLVIYKSVRPGEMVPLPWSRRGFRVLSVKPAPWRILAIAAAVILAGSVCAGEPRDGAWWGTLSRNEKHTFVLGYFDGLCGGAQWILSSLGDFSVDTEYAKRVGKFEAQNNFLVSAGVDQFYAADFRNLELPVSDAILLSLMASIGATPENLRDASDVMRRANGRQDQRAGP